MKLLTAHKILIGSGAAFFLFFGAHRYYSFQSSGDPGTLTAAGLGLLASIGLVAYFRTIGAKR